MFRFGTPGIMERASRGEYGMSVAKDYGIFPRALLQIFARYKSLLSSSGKGKYVLTANAIELSMVLGNNDMLNSTNGDEKNIKFSNSGVHGVCIDRAAKPPRIFGMEEMILESEKDIYRLFAGISSRCTTGTGLNQSSSRSHCFVNLHLYHYDPAGDTISTSRFQFVDLAGSERMEDAHGDKDYRASANAVQGMMVNYSLTMLGQAVRDLVSCRQKKKKFSFRAYLFDLIQLLSESLTGEALTAVFVCVSQAPANAGTTFNALDFGKVFSKLKLRKKLTKGIARKSLVTEAKKLYSNAESALAKNCHGRYHAIRKGQLRDSHQRLNIYNQLCKSGK